MRKLISACAVCAMAIGLVVVPNAFGVKSAKQVGGTVSVGVTPNPLPDTTTTVTASGGVASNSGCRKDRTLHFFWVNGSTVGPEVGTAMTTSNGSYTATLPRPTDTSLTTSSVTLRATVDQVTRKVGSKKKGKKTKKGRRFDCLAITGDSAPVTLVAPTP
ncbi:MAG: hypothetical protein QOD14_1431 [Solirubrobacterales bacterium]|jgi:hypothetical protein|nr:hypothetical protein [Solirubrobacterales bacterium]